MKYPEAAELRKRYLNRLRLLGVLHVVAIVICLAVLLLGWIVSL